MILTLLYARILVLENESIMLKSVPTAQYYEVSYMHRSVITHLAYSK